MSWSVAMALVSGAICAAGGQLLFAIGARGRTGVLSFVNIWIISGLALYAVGTVFFYIQSIARPTHTSLSVHGTHLRPDLSQRYRDARRAAELGGSRRSYAGARRIVYAEPQSLDDSDVTR